MVSVPPVSVVDEIEDRPTAEALLLRAARAGDRAAVEELLARHHQPLFTLCYGVLGHAEDAEDAVQEAFLLALRWLSRFEGRAAFRTWLYRIAVNVCLDRRRERRPWEPLDPEQPSTAPGSPETLALLQLRVREALGALLPRQRVVLLLKVREGWSVDEIAAALGWKKRQVEYELTKARRALGEWRQREAGEGDE